MRVICIRIFNNSTASITESIHAQIQDPLFAALLSRAVAITGAGVGADASSPQVMRGVQVPDFSNMAYRVGALCVLLCLSRACSCKA